VEAVSVAFYDPMLAKLIVHLRRVRQRKSLALDCSFVSLAREDERSLPRKRPTPRFAAGDVDTDLIPSELDFLVPSGEPSPSALLRSRPNIFDPYDQVPPLPLGSACRRFA
jgi:acetyl/propionyl-CoA carboxylase alpha subunit